MDQERPDADDDQRHFRRLAKPQHDEQDRQDRQRRDHRQDSHEGRERRADIGQHADADAAQNGQGRGDEHPKPQPL
ncbi:MAG: hypothetical protein AAFX45_15030 [Pseudomonadota bacterium]